MTAGEITVRAFKEREGVPDLLTGFYAEAYPTAYFPSVSVRKGEATKDVMIQLISPLSRLLIRAIDAQTKQTVKYVIVTMNHKDRPSPWYKRGAAERDGSTLVLIPPLIPINLTIEALGYKTWYYASSDPADQGAFQMPPDSLKELTIELQPIK